LGESEKTDPYYLKAFVASLLEQNDIDAALKYFEKLEKAKPEELETILLKARLLEKQNQGERAAELLETEAKKRDPESALFLAIVAEDLGHLAQADNLYKKYSQECKRPEGRLTWAVYVGRQKRVKEALDVCESAWKTGLPAEVAETCLAILRSTPADADQQER